MGKRSFYAPLRESEDTRLEVDTDQTVTRWVAGFEGKSRQYLIHLAGLKGVEVTTTTKTRLVLVYNEVTDEFTLEKWQPETHGPFEDIPHSMTPAEAVLLLNVPEEEKDTLLSHQVENARKKGSGKSIRLVGKIKKPR